MSDAIKISTPYTKKEEPDIIVPDHPLLETFQKALKEHLLSLIDRTKAEIYEIETEVTKKNVEMKTIGLKVYQQQELVCSRQESLGNLIQNVEYMKEKFKQEEEDLEQNIKVLKDIDGKLFDTQTTTRDITKELSSVRELNHSLEDAEDYIEGHLKVNKTIASKRRVDNETLSTHKKKQDYFIHSLVTEIWKLENEMETLTLTAIAKQAYIEDMEVKTADGNTTISALETEYKCLLQSWNAAIVAIGHRDDKLDGVKKKLKVLMNTHTNLTKEINSSKRQIKKTMVENDKLTSFHLNVLREKERNKQTYEQDVIKKDELLKDMAQLEWIINETEKDAKRVEEENKPKQLQYDQLQNELDKLVERKLNLERNIEILLFQQTCANALNKKQRRIFEEIIDKKRQGEIILRQVLNRSTAVSTEVAEQTLINEELYNQAQEIKRDISAMSAETDKLKKQVESQEFVYRREKTKYKLINEKLHDLLSRQEEGNVAPNKEVKLLELEKLIQDGEDQIKKLQQIWLCEQNTMIKLSEERQEQMQAVNVKRKQVLMSEQQNMRIHEALEQIKRQEEHTELNIRRNLVKSKRLCEDVYNKRNRKQTLDKDNIFFKNQFEEKLRDTELELLKIESEIAGIEENKLTMSKDLIECNREALAWEAKYKMTKEALIESNEEKDKGGEVNLMKNKLSQGKLFLGELKKNQDKILKELQVCISRRDSIFYKSEAKQQIESRSKRSQGDRTRKNVARKIANMKNQIKQVNNEIQRIKKEIKTLSEKILTKDDELKNITKRITFTAELQPNFKIRIEEIRTNKEMKFELLVYHQQKSEMYRLLVKDKKPFRKFKIDEDLVTEYEKQKDTNNKLRYLITRLDNQFPLRHQELVRLFNSLTILFVS